jgi:hypothetical protein
MTATYYEYQKLTEADAIRLIALDPSTDLDSPLHCELRSTSLSRCHRDLVDKYTALSYVWGYSQRTSQITVDGKMFYITASLHSALRHLRDPTRKRHIWADAICINQDDIAERNQQVGQMGSVYTIAEHTVIYLGQGTSETDQLLNALQSATNAHSLNQEETNIGAIKILLSHPWFKRVWVLQELVLSRDPWIQCGRLLVRWNDLRNYVVAIGLSEVEGKVFFDMANLRSEYLKALVTHPQPRNSALMAEGLFNLLKGRKGFGVTDARDMLFANVHLLDGIFGDTIVQAEDILEKKRRMELTQLINVDYGKTNAQVYCDLARHLIEGLSDCRILSLLGPCRGMISDSTSLPSWVVDCKYIRLMCVLFT